MVEEMKEVRERGHTTTGEDVDRDMPEEGDVARDVDTLIIRRCLFALSLSYPALYTLWIWSQNELGHSIL